MKAIDNKELVTAMEELEKERGIEKVVSRITLISGICFMTLAVLIKILD